MVIENDYFKITIEQDKTYKIDSADNKTYDIIMNPFNYSRNDYTKTMEIVIQNQISEVIRIALIGSPYGDEKNCAVLKDKELVVLVCRDIFLINIDEHKLIKNKKIDSFVDNFDIHLVDDGYILQGKTEVFKLNNELEIMFKKTNNFTGYLIIGIIFGITPTFNILYSIFNGPTFDGIGSNMISFLLACGLIFYSIIKIIKFKNIN